MKGYYISIKNNLLEEKHYKKMGSSVWLFMWLLDKMTSISEDGFGRVLGGKPIKSKEITDDLGVSKKTYYRWIKKLEKGGYIETKEAPYGIIITVNKAKKIFGRSDNSVQRSDNNVQSKGSDNNVQSNKDNTVKDNTKDNTSKKEKVKKKKWNKEDERLVELLHNTVSQRYPHLEEKFNFEKDCIEMNRLHRLDGWTYDQIEYVAKWSQEDDFWQQNILSVSKLREKFDQLVVRIKSKQNKNKSKEFLSTI